MHFRDHGCHSESVLRNFSHAVLEDVLDGFLTVESAQRDYKVVIDPATFEIDKITTESLRQ